MGPQQKAELIKAETKVHPGTRKPGVIGETVPGTQCPLAFALIKEE
jgi:hypothetical protein